MKRVSSKALAAAITVREFGGDPNRPYDGQAHTFGGKRGTQPLPSHMTLRDLGDIIAESVRAWHRGDVDALVQLVLLNVEQERASKKENA